MNVRGAFRKMFSSITPALPYAPSGYDATENRGRRRPPSRLTMHEDLQADQRRRRILASSARDMARNFAVASWAIRKHLDYVSSFTLQGKTEDRGFNTELEEYVKSLQTRYRFDVARRHPYWRGLRIAEAMRCKDGDIFWIKLRSGDNRGKIQAIESDRIRTPTYGEDKPSLKFDPREWTNGVRVGKDGAALKYAVCDRVQKTHFKLNRIVMARNMLSMSFYDRYDQVRGISPIASGLNWFKDVYEGFEYSLAKAKIGQLFGLAFSRGGEESPFGPVTPTTDSDGDGEADSDYQTTLPHGMFSVDLEEGESVDMIESKTPSSETVDFLKLMIAVAIKCLDLPTSFFDESFTNFYGSRGSLIQYLKSCKWKIQDLKDFQDEWLRWRIGIDIADGLFSLPSGRDFDWLKWEFVPDGVPWWDPIKEVRGNAMSVAAGFTNPYRVCKEIGTDFEENILKIAEATEFAEQNGVDLVYADSTAFRPEVTTEPSDE